MEAPPGIAFAQEIEWVCKEPALVVWNDPGRSSISSLGLPCPTGKPTLLTLWIGQDATNSTYVMLHLRISVRISKRRKTLDHFLLPSLGSNATESCSVVNLEDASESVRQCLEEAYGKSSTKKCLRVPFHQPKQGRVLMPLIPEGAPCLGGTALHLLTLFRSLSRAQGFEIFVGHSSYAQHALMKFASGVSAGGVQVDLLRSYAHGGVFDDWRQIGDGRSDGSATHEKSVASSRGGPQDRHRGIKSFDRATSSEVHEQPICSPPPYSPPPLQTTELPETPKETRACLDLVNSKACLKRSRVSTTPEANRPSPKFIKRGNSLSPSFSNVLNVPHEATRSFSLESTVYSPTIINTPSTVDDTPGIKPTIFTTRHEPPKYSAYIDHPAPATNQEQVLNKVASSFISNPELLDAISPKSVLRSLHKQLHALVSAKVPLLTEQTLQNILDDLLSSLEYSQNLVEVSLQETSDDLKIELQLEKDKSIEELDDHAQDVLTEVKSQMEDLASGHLVAFEDMLQRTGDQLKQTLKAFLEVLAKAVVRGDDDRNTSSLAAIVAHPPASAATKLFLHESNHLSTADKIKVLDRLAHQNTAEIFLTVDAELREAWISSWTA